MVCFQTKDPNLGKFCRVLQWKMLVYFMAIWSILRLFVIYILWSFGHLSPLHQEKSGNPVKGWLGKKGHFVVKHSL
jgi:hypothetical protein